MVFLPQILALLVLTLSFPAHPAAARSTQPTAAASADPVWDLSSLYANESAWNVERETILRDIKAVARLKGSIARDPANLAVVMDEIAALRTRAGKMALYGILASSADTRSTTAQSQLSVGLDLEGQVEEAVAFADTEIRAIGETRLASLLRHDPRLARHRQRLHQINRDTPHALNTEAQAALKSMARWRRVPGDLYNALLESDLGWKVIKDADGTDVSVNRSTFGRLRSSPSAAVRRAAIDAYFTRLRAFENVFGLLLTRRIEADLAMARQRRFGDGLEALLFQDGMPPATRRQMLDVTRSNLGALHRYTELRRRAIGLDAYTYFDMFAPAAPSRRSFSVADSKEVIVAAMAPLGEAYQRRLRERLNMPLFHLRSVPEKRQLYGLYYAVGGAYSYGIMHYTNDLNSSANFAGLAALMMTFMDLPRENLADSRHDPPIYANTVLYAGRLMHDDYLRSRATDRSERISYLIRSLDEITRSYFRNAAISDFEGRVQSLMLRDEIPGGSQLSRMYLDVLREYYSGAQGMPVDDVFGAEWMSNSVPFQVFETQGFPLALSAASLLVERVRQGDARAIRGFSDLLRRGDSDLSYDLLKEAGVDMSTGVPYESLIRRMTTLMDELEALLSNGR